MCAWTCACLLLSRNCYHQPLIQFRWICSAFYSAPLCSTLTADWCRVQPGYLLCFFFFLSAKLVGLRIIFAHIHNFSTFFIYAFWRYSFSNNFTTHARTNSLEQIDDLHCLFRLGRLQQVQTGWTFAFHARLLGTAAHIQFREKTQLTAGLSEPFHA